MMKILLAQLPVPYFTLDKREPYEPLAAGYLKAMAHEAGLLDRMDVEILDEISSDVKGDAYLLKSDR